MHYKEFHQDGILISKLYYDDEWYQHDHNGCAAETIYRADGTIMERTHFQHGHNEGQPSREIFFRNGKTEVIEFRRNWLFHNPNGPAYIEYYENGDKKHEIYFINGKQHRTDGPAEISYDKHGCIISVQYSFKGKILSKDRWERKVAKLATNAIVAKDYPCPHCQRSVNTSEKECWCCGGKLQ